MVLEAEKTEYEPENNSLRILGKIKEGPDDVPLGSYHSFNLEEGTVLTIIKKKWAKYEIARIHAIQEANGVGFDLPKAVSLHAKIAAEIATIEAIVTTQIPKRVVQVGSTVEKPFKKDGTLTKKVQEWLLNPQSEDLLIA